jgi:hypothetical protein
MTLDTPETGLHYTSSSPSRNGQQHSSLLILLVLAIAGLIGMQLSGCERNQARTQRALAKYAITATWKAPVINDDGSPLRNLASYNIYIGQSPTTLVKAASTPASSTTYTTVPLPAGTYFFAITALSTDGVESKKVVHQVSNP